jgi:soluble lytic murein transglycosylase
MIQLFRPLPCLFVLAALVGTSSNALAARHKETLHERKAEAARHERKDSVKKEEKRAKETKKETKRDEKKSRHAEHSGKRHKKARAEEKSAEKDAPKLTGDAAIVKDVIDLARHAKTNEATDAAKAITDPAAQKLAEWFILRHPDSLAHFNRYATFISDYPEWPGTVLLRRRAEAHLWQEKSDSATVHAFTSDQPLTAKGRFALARTRLGEGDRDGARRMAQAAFRSEELSERAEADVLDVFRDMFGRDDYQARMDKMIGAKDMSAAMRAAHHIGDDAVSIVKACSAVKGSDDKASDRLDSVAQDARSDLGYVLCRVQWLMRKDKIAEASRLIQGSRPETMALQDTDEWWRVRRVLARKLLDQRDYRNAYEVVRAAAPPASENYRGESQFMPGWIALRYLDDARTAATHFAHIDDGSVNPTTLARASYWRGRAAETLGEKDTARAYYEVAAQHCTAYYGQLARARLGFARLELRAPPQGEAAQGPRLKDEIARAAEMLYTIGEREVAVAFAADLGGESNDVATLSAVAEVTGRNNDARSMLELGKAALSRGLAVDNYAFPTIGIPRHNQFGIPIDRSIIYSVVRTESAFNQRDKSSANAVGLMQVTPEAGRDTAKRFGVEYDWDRMVSDPVYNTQMGAAELSALLSEYKGSFIMTFAGYNAGRGRVRDWVKAYGDPRDPNVDPVDWAERIPFAETRNYVQRVMENLLVYRHRFEDGAPALAGTDQRPAATQEVMTRSIPVP